MKLFQIASFASLTQASFSFFHEHLPDGWEFNMEFDNSAARLRFDVKIPANTYFGIAYGTNMIGVDLVSFHGRGSGDVNDLWSSFYGEPDIDAQNDYECTNSVSDGWYTFECYRDLQTSDPNEEDFQFTQCHQNMEMAWVGLTTSAEMAKHDVNNFFTLSLPENCFELVDPATLYYELSSNYLSISAISAMALSYFMI